MYWGWSLFEIKIEAKYLYIFFDRDMNKNSKKLATSKYIQQFSVAEWTRLNSDAQY